MKIISKYKDYYDYLQGIYGVDEKLVLDRTKGEAKNFSMWPDSHILVVCGKILEFVCFGNKFYFGEKIAQFNKNEELNKWSSWGGIKPTYLINLNINSKNILDFKKIYYPELSDDIHNIYPAIKKLSNKCPIFTFHKSSETIDIEFPSLAALGVNKCVDAHTIWVLLSEWLGRKITENEPHVPTGDDKIRILNAGFDLRTSFRNIK